MQCRQDDVAFADCNDYAVERLTDSVENADWIVISVKRVNQRYRIDPFYLDDTGTIEMIYIRTETQIKRQGRVVENNSGYVSGLRMDFSDSSLNGQNMRKYRKNQFLKGFTLVEIIIVVVILGIAAALVIPTVSNAADMQVRSAANRIAADLDYAKGLAITHQSSYSVVFDVTGESYEILDSVGNPVKNPLTGQSSFVVDFSADSRLSRVNVVSADFDSDASNAITFDYLGSPYYGTSPTPGNSLNIGQITLQADNFTLTVDVEPVTGYITISP